MIKINLLPRTYRKPTASSAQQLARSPLALIAISILASLLVLLTAIAQLRQSRLAELEAKAQAIEPQKTTVDALAASVQKLREQKVLLERMVRSRSQWARHLNLLSNVTPQGVWFTDLSLDADKGLVIQGSAIGQGGKEMVQIGRLAQELKADPVFSSTIRDIQIQSIESVQEKEVEVIHFTLTGALAAPAGGSTP